MAKQKSPALIYCLHILVLFAFAVAQPIFDLTSRYPEFFVARRSEPIDLFLMILALSLIFPLLAVPLQAGAALIGRRFHAWVHGLLAAVLLGAIVLQVLKRLPFLPGGLSVLTAMIAGSAVSVFYLRWRPASRYLTLLSPAIVIFPAWFLLNSGISKVAFPEQHPESSDFHVQTTAPVVMVVFDELPVVSLLDEEGTIDAVRYPNFAALAQESYWFRDASTVSDSTLVSVPAILTGNYPDPFGKEVQLPIPRDHPRNLFSLLEQDYELHIFENATRLYAGTKSEEPVRERLRSLFSDLSVLYAYLLLPADLTSRLPSVTQSWKDFWTAQGTFDAFEIDLDNRSRKFREFVDSIHRREPCLYFFHSMLPHHPWRYLPGGKRYFLEDVTAIPGTVDQSRHRGLQLDPNWVGKKWLEDEWLVVQSYQRHLLQLGYTDRLLGLLISRLKELGLYDQSVIVVTADHGACFRPHEWMRGLTETNYADIIAVPLLIKTPHQEKGVLSDRNVETVDILPSIADALDIDLPWDIGGRSALDPAAPERTQKTVVDGQPRKWAFEGTPEWRNASLRRKIRIFGSGSWDGVFAIGPHPGLFGKPTDEIGIAGTAEAAVQTNGDTFFEDVHLNSQLLPAHISGRFLVLPEEQPHALAIAVNGVVQAITRTSTLLPGDWDFSALLPETAFREGRNEVEIFLVSPSQADSSPRLIQMTNARLYEWETVVEFGSQGEARRYQAEGWSHPESSFTWTEGKQASLVLETSKPDRDVVLTATVTAFLSKGKLEEQNVVVLVNRRKAGEWRIQEDGFRTQALSIPAEFFTDARTVITFETPDAASPAELGSGPDERVLGLAFTSLRLSQSSDAPE